jgi:3-oxoacyl-[acyl-carrier-protein] synthase-3
VCVPDRILSNADLEKMVDTSDDWIVSRTGIRERRILAPGQQPFDIALPAAQRALEDANVVAADIDAILFCTYTPDFSMPPSACLIQHGLGTRPCLAYDLNAACSGFVFGLQSAYGLVHSGIARHVLVLGVDCNSRAVDYTDRNTCVLFGDGAGAVVVGRVPEGRGMLGHSNGSDGSGAELIQLKIGGAALPIRPEALASKECFISMNGREVYKFAVNIIDVALEEAASRAGIRVSEMDLLVPHQANTRIIRSAMEKFGLREDQVVINMDRYGNTSAASIPLALDTARQEGRLRPGTLCGLVAFGGGLTYGATILRW